VTTTPRHRARFLLGLALASAAGIGLGHGLLQAGREAVAEARAQRTAVASLLQLVDLVGRSGGEGEAVRAAVARWQSHMPAGSSARVIRFSGIRLEASTAPADAGEKAAPRRLAREEKPLFDVGQRLRAAVQSNREGGAEKPELEVTRTPGGYALAAPVEANGEVVGAVLVDVPPAPPAPSSPLVSLLAVILPVLVFAGASRFVPDRRAPQAVLAFGILLAGLVAFGRHAVATLSQDRQEGSRAVSAHVKTLAAETTAALADQGKPAEPPVRPGTWDADVFRRPLGFLKDDGSPDPERIAAAGAQADREVLQGLAVIGAIAAALLALGGFGALARLGEVFRRHRAAYLYILPAMIGVVLLVFFPFLYGIALSFTDSNIYNQNRPLGEIWIALRNYGAILGDWHMIQRGADGALAINYQSFYYTLGFTIFWTVTNVALGVTSGLILALALNVKGLAFRPIYRVLLILPWAMPNYITALIWRGMFHQQFGVVNQALALLGFTPIAWFDRPVTSFLTAFATNGWLSFPFMMVVTLGALQSIPADLYEAARVDGASRWQQFSSITLPSLKPALVPAIILSVVWTFNMFNIIYLVTAGEPDRSTEILVTQAYRIAFQQYRYGYAAAYSTIIFVILLVYGVFQNKITHATEGI
jgi:arabinogalactan oligomer/maltooligosaccharide transport system permease protein